MSNVQEIDISEVPALIRILEKQRETANTAVAVTEARNSLLMETVAKQQQDIAELQAALAARQIPVPQDPIDRTSHGVTEHQPV